MSDNNDQAQEGLVEYVRHAFNGTIEKEESMARQIGGEQTTNWISIADGEWFEGIYKGWDPDIVVGKYEKHPYYFEINGVEREFSQASTNGTFKNAMSGIKQDQLVKVGRIGKGPETKYRVSVID